MPPTQQDIDAARATLAAAGEPLSNAGPVVSDGPPFQGDKAGDAPAESSPPTEVPPEPDAVQQEAGLVEAAAKTPSVDTIAAAAEPVVTGALAALAQVKAEKPQADFAEQLKEVADKGLAAVLNPADESAILGALVTVIKEVVA